MTGPATPTDDSVTRPGAGSLQGGPEVTGCRCPRLGEVQGSDRGQRLRASVDAGAYAPGPGRRVAAPPPHRVTLCRPLAPFRILRCRPPSISLACTRSSYSYSHFRNNPPRRPVLFSPFISLPSRSCGRRQRLSVAASRPFRLHLQVTRPRTERPSLLPSVSPVSAPPPSAGPRSASRPAPSPRRRPRTSPRAPPASRAPPWM